MENSIMTGFKSMVFDIFAFLKMALSTKKGLAVFTICTFIYFLSLYICGGVNILGLLIAIFAILAFFVLSWLIWFRPSNDSDE